MHTKLKAPAVVECFLGRTAAEWSWQVYVATAKESFRYLELFGFFRPRHAQSRRRSDDSKLIHTIWDFPPKKENSDGVGHWHSSIRPQHEPTSV